MIAQRVDADSRTVAVRIDLPNRERLLRPGISGTAWLPVGNQGTWPTAGPAAAHARSLVRVHPERHAHFEIDPWTRPGCGRSRDAVGVRAGEAIVDGAFLLKAETERSAADGKHGEKHE